MQTVTLEHLQYVDGMKRNVLHCAVITGNIELVNTVVSVLSEKNLINKMKWLDDVNDVTPLTLAMNSQDIFSLIFNASDNTQPTSPIDPELLSVIRRNQARLLATALSADNLELVRQILDKCVGNPLKLCGNFNNYFNITIPSTALETTVAVVVVGDSGAGKSSLINSLKVEGTFSWLKHFVLCVPGADTHTAGIIPTHFESVWFGKVVFFDLSSHREFVHEAILNCGSLVDAVFLVVVNLYDNIEEIAQQIVYWLRFIRYHHSKVASDQALPNVIIVGSHLHDIKLSDVRIGNRERFRYHAYHRAMNRITRHHFNIASKAVMDCRKTSPDNAILRFDLASAFVPIRNGRKQLPTKSYILYEIIKMALVIDNNKPLAIQVGQLVEELKTDQRHCQLFYGTTDEIIELCKPLVELNLLLILSKDGSPIEEHWVVPDSHPLLTEIERAIFHGNDESINGSQTSSEHRDHFPFNKDGLLSQHDIMTLFEGPDSLCNTDLLILLMIHYKYCEEIKTRDNEICYFFPHLLKRLLNVPQWDKEDDRFMFAWTIAPESDYHYFLPHLIHHFLLQLSQEEELCIDNLERATRSLAWGDPSGVEVIVHIHSSQRLLVSMRSTPDHQLNCLKLRKLVLRKIGEILKSLEANDEDSTRIVESIIPVQRKANFPLADHASIESKSIRHYKTDTIEAAVYTAKQDAIQPSKHAGPLVSIDKLLFFEPYYHIGNLLRDRIYQSSDDNITQEDYYDIGIEFGSIKLRLLDALLDNIEQPLTDVPIEDQIRQSYLRLMARHGGLTYRQLRDRLDSISFFELEDIQNMEAPKTPSSPIH